MYSNFGFVVKIKQVDLYGVEFCQQMLWPIEPKVTRYGLQTLMFASKPFRFLARYGHDSSGCRRNAIRYLSTIAKGYRHHFNFIPIVGPLITKYQQFQVKPYEIRELKWKPKTGYKFNSCTATYIWFCRRYRLCIDDIIELQQLLLNAKPPCIVSDPRLYQAVGFDL
jgi:hypothetical protein